MDDLYITWIEQCSCIHSGITPTLLTCGHINRSPNLVATDARVRGFSVGLGTDRHLVAFRML